MSYVLFLIFRINDSLIEVNANLRIHYINCHQNEINSFIIPMSFKWIRIYNLSGRVVYCLLSADKCCNITDEITTIMEWLYCCSIVSLWRTLRDSFLYFNNFKYKLNVTNFFLITVTDIPYMIQVYWKYHIKYYFIFNCSKNFVIPICIY